MYESQNIDKSLFEFLPQGIEVFKIVEVLIRLKIETKGVIKRVHGEQCFLRVCDFSSLIYE